MMSPRLPWPLVTRIEGEAPMHAIAQELRAAKYLPPDGLPKGLAMDYPLAGASWEVRVEQSELVVLVSVMSLADSGWEVRLEPSFGIRPASISRSFQQKEVQAVRLRQTEVAEAIQKALGQKESLRWVEDPLLDGPT